MQNNLAKWTTTIANNVAQMATLAKSLARTTNTTSKKNLQARIDGLKKWNANAQKWVDSTAKRLTDMTAARAKKLENEAFQAEVNAMKTEYDKLTKFINDAKKRMDDTSKKGESLTDKKLIAANKSLYRTIKAEYDVAKAR